MVDKKTLKARKRVAEAKCAVNKGEDGEKDIIQFNMTNRMQKYRNENIIYYI